LPGGVLKLQVCSQMFSCLGANPMDYPRHIAVVPDGNRRHARRALQSTASGYAYSRKALQTLVDWCLAKNIKELSIFAWSSENWSRPADEVESAMQQFEKALDKWSSDDQNDIAFHFVSTSPHKLNSTLRLKMHTLSTTTRENTKLKCYIYASYGFAEDVERVKIGNFRVSSAVPDHATDPDVLIRTSGERRLSNFCLWHLRYTELIFIPTLFPDCDAEVWDDCMVEYSSRQRRYGQ